MISRYVRAPRVKAFARVRFLKSEKAPEGLFRFVRKLRRLDRFRTRDWIVAIKDLQYVPALSSLVVTEGAVVNAA